MKSKDSHIGLISWGNGNSGSRDHSDIQRTRFCLVSSSSVGKGLPLRRAEGASRRNPEIRSLPFRGLGFWVWDWVLGLGSDWDFSLGSTERRLTVVRTPHPALESNLDNSSGRLLPPLITRFQVFFLARVLPNRQLPNIKKQFPLSLPSSTQLWPSLKPGLNNNLLPGLCVDLFIVCNALTLYIPTLSESHSPCGHPKKVFKMPRIRCRITHWNIQEGITQQMEMQMGSTLKDLRGSRCDNFGPKPRPHLSRLRAQVSFLAEINLIISGIINKVSYPTRSALRRNLTF